MSVRSDMAREAAMRRIGVGEVSLHELTFVKDPRGDLAAGEFERQVPFAARRYFMVFDVPGEHVRGEHAHRACHQFLLCARGQCRVGVDDGRESADVVLDRPNVGLYLPPMIWTTHSRHSADALLLVFASEYYDPADYIRDYGEFLAQVRRRRPP